MPKKSTKGKTYEEIYGKEKAEEYRKRKSEALKGRKFSKEHKRKIKQACLKKYGVDNVGKLEEIRKKGAQTCLKKYGVDSYSKTNNFKKKTKQTWSKKNNSELNRIKEKKKQTCLKKYGVDNPSKSEIIKKQTRQTCLKKYGVNYPMQNPNISAKVWARNENIWSSKLQNTIFNELIKFFPSIKPNRNIWISEIKKCYNCDIVFKEKMKIIEIFGDYWHCNPKIFKENYFHKQTNKTANEIWQYDNQKIERLENKGWQVLILWECDIRKNFNEVIKKGRKFLRSR